VESVFGVESPAYVAIRATLSLCSIGLLGALALRFVVLPRYTGPDATTLRAAINQRLPRWIDTLGVVAVMATAARLAAQHAAVFGTNTDASGETLATLLFRAGWARTWWIALVSAIAVTWLAPRLRHRSTAAWVAVTSAIVVFAASQPWSGHPAAAARPLAAIATQLVHVIGAGGWVGSLALLTFVAIPAAQRLGDDGAVDGDVDVDARIAGLVRAFSPTALTFAALLGLSGLITASSNLGGIAPLWQSAYGRTLSIKLSLLAIVAGTGAYNWRRVLPELGRPSATAALRRSSLVELGAALLVLVITAVLVATPMPDE
jgi:putative copper export protein